jgi:hypothetical protein
VPFNDTVGLRGAWLRLKQQERSSPALGRAGKQGRFVGQQLQGRAALIRPVLPALGMQCTGQAVWGVLR